MLGSALKESKLSESKCSKKKEANFKKQLEKLNDIPDFSLQNEKKVDRVNLDEIKFLFDALRDITAEKPYHEDGDHEMYTDENLEKRKKLKEDPEVSKAIASVKHSFLFSVP